MPKDTRMNFNQVDMDINRWLPAESRFVSINTANRTMLRMFFEDLRNTNNAVEAIRNTAKRVEPFGFSSTRVMSVTQKWREAHGLKSIIVFSSGTRKPGVQKRVILAASAYFDQHFESTEEVAKYLEGLITVTSANPDAEV